MVVLTEEQWDLLEPLLPKAIPREDGRGRPRSSPRDVLDGILWVLRTGAPWADLPRRFPSYQTCHRWFSLWARDGTMKRILCALLRDLQDRGKIDLSEAFVDGSFVGAKKGGPSLVRAVAAKGPSSWQSRTAMVFLSPLTLRLLRATK